MFKEKSVVFAQSTLAVVLILKMHSFVCEANRVKRYIIKIILCEGFCVVYAWQ